MSVITPYVFLMESLNALLILLSKSLASMSFRSYSAYIVAYLIIAFKRFCIALSSESSIS